MSLVGVGMQKCFFLQKNMSLSSTSECVSQKNVEVKILPCQGDYSVVDEIYEALTVQGMDLAPIDVFLHRCKPFRSANMSIVWPKQPLRWCCLVPSFEGRSGEFRYPCFW